MIAYHKNTLALYFSKQYEAYAHARIEEIRKAPEDEITINLNTIIGELRANPNDPCARYKEVLGMRAQYKNLHGENQLTLDYKSATEALREINENKNNRKQE